MIDRRELLVGAGALAFTSALPAWAGQGAGLPLEAYLAGVAEDLLADYPENATALGLDNGAPRRAQVAASPTARSPAAAPSPARGGAAGAAPGDRSRRPDPGRADRSRRRPTPRTRLAVEGFAFPYGDVAVLNQNGPTATRLMRWRRIPAPSSRSPICSTATTWSRTAADAEAYLARLEAYAGALDGETERLAHDAAHRRGRARFPARQEPQPDDARVRAAADRALGPGRPRSPAAPPPCPADFGRARRGARHATRSRRRWTARSPSSSATAPAPPPTPASGSCPRARLIMPGRSRPGRPRRVTPDEVHAQGLEQLRELQAEMDPSCSAPRA